MRPSLDVKETYYDWQVSFTSSLGLFTSILGLFYRYDWRTWGMRSDKRDLGKSQTRPKES